MRMRFSLNRFTMCHCLRKKQECIEKCHEFTSVDDIMWHNCIRKSSKCKMYICANDFNCKRKFAKAKFPRYVSIHMYPKVFGTHWYVPTSLSLPSLSLSLYLSLLLTAISQNLHVWRNMRARNFIIFIICEISGFALNNCFCKTK